MRTITLDAMAWNSEVIVIIGGDRGGWLPLFKSERVKKQNRNYWAERMEGCSFGRGQHGAITMFAHETPWHVYVYFPKKPRLKDVEANCTVVHEFMHAAIAILRQKQVTLCAESEEAFTYLTEHLVRSFWARVS